MLPRPQSSRGSMSTDSRRFNLPLIALHWLMLALIALAYATSELQEAFEHTPTEGLLQDWHTVSGIAVLGATALRLVVRAFTRVPAIVPNPPRWQEVLAALAHVALYGLMIALPLTGWLVSNADGKDVAWFGTQLPTLLGPSKGLAKVLEDVHEAIATAGYFLIGLHAAAALFHHYVVRDNTLRLMLPGCRGRGAR